MDDKVPKHCFGNSRGEVDRKCSLDVVRSARRIRPSARDVRSGDKHEELPAKYIVRQGAATKLQLEASSYVPPAQMYDITT